MRCWILLCSDMAIRSGTAALIAPEHYDKQTRSLTFTTKYAERQRLTVTAELAELLNPDGLDPKTPYVAQLPRGSRVTGKAYRLQPLGHMHSNNLRARFRRLAESLGIRRDLKPHDLRRTTAVNVYRLTRDLRTVQALLGHGDLNSTLWYLDHHMTDVQVETLELAKLNPTTETVQ